MPRSLRPKGAVGQSNPPRSMMFNTHRQDENTRDRTDRRNYSGIKHNIYIAVNECRNDLLSSLITNSNAARIKIK